MSLFPEPSTAEKVASVTHLLADATRKMEIAAQAMDRRAVAYWLAEAERLDRLRGTVVNNSQQELSL